MAAAIAFLYSMSKSVPIVNQWVQSLIALYVQDQILSAEQKNEHRKEEVNFVTEKIKYAKTNDERRVLLRVLYKL